MSMGSFISRALHCLYCWLEKEYTQRRKKVILVALSIIYNYLADFE